MSAIEPSCSRQSNQYLKRIKYGNRQPLLLDTTAPSFRSPHTVQPNFHTADWMFEVVFDYGEGHYTEQAPDQRKRVFATASLAPSPDSPWSLRQDPFSSYRAGFEVRTYRRCQRVLMFHHFPNELPTPNYLVRSTELTYSESPGRVIADRGHAVRVRAPGRWNYLKKSLPPVEFEYSQAEVQEQIHDIDSTQASKIYPMESMARTING